MDGTPPGPRTRRSVLAGVAGGIGTALAGCSALEPGTDAEATPVDDDRATTMAERFAPTVYFDEHEQWFPTDPRPYERERDGETVVDGFDALDGYVRRGGADDPPDPTAFYRVVAYEGSPLSVVQYWFYSAFDQFTTNFHWHDWELLQVFVDTETDEPQLYVASSHSRKVPNNEFLDPDGSRQPRILTELGSHSSGLSVNDVPEQFQRLPTGDGVADITNRVIEGVESIESIPLAYGLPRDEGSSLPYAVPELDGDPVYEHDRLPNVDRSDLVTEALTVRSFDALGSPPDLPKRETGLRFDHENHAAADTDVTYDLVPTAELEHVDDFTGPQLSFEFAVPQFAEDAVASHITTVAVPWQSERYDNPAADVSDPDHRRALAERYEAIGEPAPVNQVVANVTEAVSNPEAPDGEGLTTADSSTELFALLQSEPEAVPTFDGIAVVQDVPAGEHALTVNGAGVAPHSETVSVGDTGTTTAGVAGEIPVVARENAVKIEVDSRGTDRDLTDLAVEDDFAGRLYDAPLGGPDGVYVHRGGAFTTEVRDSDDEVGAFRVNPDPGAADDPRARVENPTTGKVPLAEYLADVAAETRDEIAALDDGDRKGRANAVNGLANALDAVAEAAQRAAERAAAGDRGNADRYLQNVARRLDRVATRLAEAQGSVPDPLARATEHRLSQARRRNEQARRADKLGR